jgi:hypothetical protein
MTSTASIKNAAFTRSPALFNAPPLDLRDPAAALGWDESAAWHEFMAYYAA